MNPTVGLQRLGILTTRIISLKLADRIAIKIGQFYCYFFNKKRGYIKKNLQHIFNSKDSVNFNPCIKRTFENFALCMVDFFRLAFLTREEIIKNVKSVGIENLNKALKFNRGCILLTLHLGNWDFAGTYLAAQGLPMSALVEETDREIFQLYKQHRERTGMKTFPLAKAGYAFLDTIKNNRCLAILADRDIAKDGILVDFLSGRRTIPKNLARIVVKKKFPILFGYVVLNTLDKGYRYLVVVESPVFFEDTQKFNKFMVKKFEDIIRCYPDQWFVFHSEWLT